MSLKNDLIVRIEVLISNESAIESIIHRSCGVSIANKSQIVQDWNQVTPSQGYQPMSAEPSQTPCKGLALLQMVRFRLL